MFIKYTVLENIHTGNKKYCLRHLKLSDIQQNLSPMPLTSSHVQKGLSAWLSCPKSLWMLWIPIFSCPDLGLWQSENGTAPSPRDHQSLDLSRVGLYSGAPAAPDISVPLTGRLSVVETWKMYVHFFVQGTEDAHCEVTKRWNIRLPSAPLLGYSRRKYRSAVKNDLWTLR